MLSSLPPSWRARITPEAQAKTLIQERLGLGPSEATRVVRAYLRDHPAAFWLPDIAAVLFILGLLYAGNVATEALDHFVQGRSRWLGLLNPVVSLALLAALVTVTTLVYTGLRNRLLLRPIRRCIDLPACFHCDHSLQGSPHVDGRLICPECGTPYPCHAGRRAP